MFVSRQHHFSGLAWCFGRRRGERTYLSDRRDKKLKARKSMSRSKRGKLIEVELTRIRQMVEQVDNDYLLYFIDMAISEVGASDNNYRNDNKKDSALRGISGLKQG